MTMSIQIEKSGIEVREADADDLERWNGYVERSPHGNPFHTYEALQVMAKHSRSKLHPLVGFKGQEAVGIFPIFEITKGPVSAVFSPPPGLLASYLGPALLNMDKLKQRKAERRHKRFVNGCMDWLDAEIDPKYMHVRTDGRYGDLRPLLWQGFRASPRYTYVVDLTVGEDALFDGFSSDARSNIRSGRDADVDLVVEEGGRSDIRRIISKVQSRYDAQDKQYPLTADFVVDLYEATPPGTVRPYVCRVDGEFQGGMIALEDDDTIYRWQGGAKHDADLPINDIVDWRIITDAIDRGIETYDLVGANKERLCGYKAKFSPTLRTYYEMERGTRSMNVVSNLYKRFR